MAGFELVALAGGIHSLRSLENGQTFHPVVGPAAEAQAVHVRGTRLVERADALPPGEPFVIWDVGLGAAANALTAINALTTGCRLPRDITLLSFDHSVAALDFALANAAALAYPLLHVSTLETLRAEHRTSLSLPYPGAFIHWQLCLDDFPARLASPSPLPPPHAIFYDPYSPTANPDMWTLDTFTALHHRLHPSAPCLLTTYTRSTAVRVTLLLSGFFVGIGGATGEKDETTVAANSPALLTHPLPRSWLEKKVYASTNAAPLRTTSAASPIGERDFETLRAHPQFRDE